MSFIIAECCQNHQGSRETLQRMIREAALAGARYAKIQTIFTEDLVPRGRFEEGLIEENGVMKTIRRPYAPEYERLHSLELSEDDHRWFIDACNNAGITPITTVFSRSRIPMLAALPWPERVVKVASCDCGSHQMIEELCAYFDHLIISTGGAYEEEIRRTAEIVRRQKKKLTLLHCVTRYPNPLHACNLRRMEWLRSFADEVGWSDHTHVERDGLIAAKAALALGADVIERHFTVLGAPDTKDGPVSITPALLADLCAYTALPQDEQRRLAQAGCSEEDWRMMLGEKQPPITHEEMLNRDYYRGRFASRVGEKYIWNWSEEPVFS